jgi:hypothetical protein
MTRHINDAAVRRTVRWLVFIFIGSGRVVYRWSGQLSRTRAHEHPRDNPSQTPGRGLVPILFNPTPSVGTTMVPRGVEAPRFWYQDGGKL